MVVFVILVVVMVAIVVNIDVFTVVIFIVVIAMIKSIVVKHLRCHTSNPAHQSQKLSPSQLQIGGALVKTT